jgi:hypothetical protein
MAMGDIREASMFLSGLRAHWFTVIGVLRAASSTR